MDPDSQIILLTSNIEKLEKLIDDLIDNVDSKRKKIQFLKVISLKTPFSVFFAPAARASKYAPHKILRSDILKTREGVSWRYTS